MKTASVMKGLSKHFKNEFTIKFINDEMTYKSSSMSLSHSL